MRREWVVYETEPHVSLKIKDVFRRVSKTATGQFRFPDDSLHCFDLLWFMDRYPLRASKEDLARLKRGRKSFISEQDDIEGILSGSTSLTQYPGLAEGCELWAYQQIAVEMFRKRGRMLLGDDIGLGKTNSAIGCMLTPGSLPCAVVCEVHVMEQWAERVREFSNLRVHVISKATAYKLPEADVYIFSYSRIDGWVDVVAHGAGVVPEVSPKVWTETEAQYAERVDERRKKVEAAGGLLPDGRLDGGFFKMLVWDEPQSLRNGFKTEKGKAARVFSESIGRILGLTATPVMNYGIDMFNVMEFIVPGLFGEQEEFIREWCEGDDKRVADPDALGAYLREQHALLRRTEDDVDRAQPQPNVLTHYVAFDEKRAERNEELAYTLAIRSQTGSFMERGSAFRQLDALTRMSTGLAKAAGVAEYVRILLEADLPVLLSGWHRECFARGTSVRMADGSTRSIEDVRVGQQVLGPGMSGTRRVLSLVRGRGEMYRIVPNKGDSWVCSENHILVLKPSEGKNRDLKKMTVAQYLNLSDRARRRYILVRSEAVEFKEAQDVMEPWFLGYWLGDGAASLKNLMVSSADIEVADELHRIADRHGLKVNKYACKGGATPCCFYQLTQGANWRRAGNRITVAFKNLGLSNNKHIPAVYKTASIPDRLMLLAGLLDSDGHTYKGNGVGTVEFTNTNETLIRDVADVARSLGFAAYIGSYEVKSGFSKQSGGTIAFRLTISGDVDRIPFVIERKRPGKRRQIKSVLAVGFKVESLGIDDFYGFEIDGDHLFLLEDYTIVHNCYDIWLDELREWKPLLYTGTETNRAKERHKSAFIAGDSNLLIISNRSGAGLDGLQARCQDFVAGELDWSPQVLKQLVGRLRRYGQEDIVNAHYMIANGGCDPLMVETLGIKSSQAHGIMNPTEQPKVATHDTSRMQRLAEMVIERRKAKLEGDVRQGQVFALTA
jgi:intein/homing endonuclease